VIAATEGGLIKRLNDRRESMNKTKVMISGEWPKVTQKAVRWPCGVCGRGQEALVIIQYSVLAVVVRSGYTGNVVV